MRRRSKSGFRSQLRTGDSCQEELSSQDVETSSAEAHAMLMEACTEDREATHTKGNTENRPEAKRGRGFRSSTALGRKTRGS